MICVPAAGRPAFRVGAWDRNGRKNSEDGADDHISDKQARSLCGRKGQAQSRQREALARVSATFSANFQMFRESVLSAPRDDCMSERASKVFELRSEKPPRGSRNEEAQCLCGMGRRLRPMTTQLTDGNVGTAEDGPYAVLRHVRSRVAPAGRYSLQRFC
jgi:hypothetical protein